MVCLKGGLLVYGRVCEISDTLKCMALQTRSQRETHSLASVRLNKRKWHSEVSSLLWGYSETSQVLRPSGIPYPITSQVLRPAGIPDLER